MCMCVRPVNLVNALILEGKCKVGVLIEHMKVSAGTVFGQRLSEVTSRQTIVKVYLQYPQKR